MILRPPAILAACALVFLPVACGSKASQSVILVNVSAESDVAGVMQLRATFSNGADHDTKVFPPQPSPTPLVFPTSFSVTLSASRTGTLEIALDGTDATEKVVANGTGTTTLDPGGKTEITVTLATGAATCGNHKPDPGEECDDGNRLSGDGCDFMCHIEAAVDGGAGDGRDTGEMIDFVDAHISDDAPTADHPGDQSQSVDARSDIAAADVGVTVGGTVTGLTGTGLVLQNRGNNLAISANGTFAFPVFGQTTYDITVLTQPVGQACRVKNGSGPVAGTSISNVIVTCALLPWSRQIGSNGEDFGRGVATDTNGNVYVAGETGGALEGNGNAISLDLVLIKFTADGTRAWTRQLRSSATTEAGGVATDVDGNVYVTGNTIGDLDGNARLGGNDIFITKYNTGGTKIWTRQFGTSAGDYGLGIVVDANRNIYVTGNTAGDLDGNANAGGVDVFVAKYDTSGTKVWIRQLGSSGSDGGTSIATDRNGNVFVTGYTTGSLEAGVDAAGSQQVFVVKYDGTGNKIWTRQTGGGSTLDTAGVATDFAGNIYLTGSTRSALDGNVRIGGEDVFIMKYDTGGNKMWTRLLGSTMDGFGMGLNDRGTGIASDSSGNLYITGSTSACLDEAANKTNCGDVFVAKYDTNGSITGTNQRESGSSLRYGVALDTMGSVFVAGTTNGRFDGNVSAGNADIFLIRYDAQAITP